MLCVKYAKKTSATILFNVFSKSWYSRRNDKSTDSYKIVQANSENLNDVDGAVLGINSNWELLTPRGFRFYLPGSIGPGWSDVTTTIQVKTQLVDLHPNKQILVDDPKEKSARLLNRSRRNNQHSELRYVAQECPLLLRKGIEELFPGCLDVGSPQLTIVTVSQSINRKVMKWNKEIETEKLAKYFVLAASDICAKLRRMGYWADFINPFSGQPHLNLQKNSTLYKTDERFRCLGFKILHRNNCKITRSFIEDFVDVARLYDSIDNTVTGTVLYVAGNFYTTAPASTEILREILHECELVNVNEA